LTSVSVFLAKGVKSNGKIVELDPMSNFAIKKTYIYGNSQILAQHDGSYSAPRYFYLHDRLGSVRQIIDTGGHVVCRYTYNPFGELFATETEDNSTLLNPFKYTGQYFDTETGLYYFRARIYDPYLNRFTTYDPIFGKFEEPLTLHKYLYCGNEPINRIDTTGLWWEITHRSFGQFGFGTVTIGHPITLFDYGALDKDYSAFNPLYTWMHFRSREAVYPNILMAAASGNATMFGYMMHEWQDSYVHYDNYWRWYTAGHIPGDIYNYFKNNPFVDDPANPANMARHAYERCDYTTRELEKIWFKYNIDLWINTPTADLPMENPWYSVFIGASSPLIDY
jgi:RHS repeat-associated protein